MPYAGLADAVVSIHFLWIIFLMIGGWWGRRYRWLRAIHIAGLAFAFLVESFDWFCPLTHIEVWLRGKGAQAGYHDSFIVHYLNKLIYMELPHTVIVVLTLLLCLGNVWVYLSARNR